MSNYVEFVDHLFVLYSALMARPMMSLRICETDMILIFDIHNCQDFHWKVHLCGDKFEDDDVSLKYFRDWKEERNSFRWMFVCIWRMWIAWWLLLDLQLSWKTFYFLKLLHSVLVQIVTSQINSPRSWIVAFCALVCFLSSVKDCSRLTKRFICPRVMRWMSSTDF